MCGPYHLRCAQYNYLSAYLIILQAQSAIQRLLNVTPYILPE